MTFRLYLTEEIVEEKKKRIHFESAAPRLYNYTPPEPLPQVRSCGERKPWIRQKSTA